MPQINIPPVTLTFIQVSTCFLYVHLIYYALLELRDPAEANAQIKKIASLTVKAAALSKEKNSGI